jgi:hypothetical protein
MLMSFALMSLLAVAATTYIDRTTLNVRQARHNMLDIQTTNLCEAASQQVLLQYWRPFKSSQKFTSMDAALSGASVAVPKGAVSGTIAGIGAYAAAITSFVQLDSYTRLVTIRSVGWIDRNGNGSIEAGEATRTVDVVARYELQRSQVFDYTYFVNNYGWMYGFTSTNLIVNGDMRANGNFTIGNGSGTINGSVIASMNEKLVPGAAGVVSGAINKWSQSEYTTQYNNLATPHRTRMRQPYNSAIHGAIGSAEFEKWRDLVYMDQASIVRNKLFGVALQDVNGIKNWTLSGSTMTTTLIDSKPTQEVIMPDITNFGNVNDAADSEGSRYAKSKAYRDEKQTFADGTPNPRWVGATGTTNELNGDGSPNVNYAGAYVDVWDSGLNRYRRVSSNGVVNGSALLIGTTTNPIRIHGPVAFNGDVALSGTVQGQGTLYAARNVHVIGSVRYKDAPDFTGSNMTAIEQANEKKDFLGLAAAQSVMMGNTTTFGNNPLDYMSPPFTKARYDDNGNLIPAFDARATDSWGIKKYQSLLETNPATKTAYTNAAAGGVNQIDAILYTNFVGGGNVGTAGGGMTLNGTIISKDEAIVTWSLPIRFNYDNRIRERTVTNQPLIDIDLPRSPAMLRSSWQDRGFTP